MKTVFAKLMPCAVLLAALCQSGCSVVGPDYKTPTAHELLPMQFPGDATSSAPARTDAAWWKVFNDPALDSLVDTALAQGPDLAVADASIRQSRAARGQVAAQSQPQINADGRLGRDQLSRNGEMLANVPFANPVLGFTDYKIGFDASWEIDFFGHQQRSVESADARLGSIEQQRADAALRVAAEVARNVLDYRYWQLRLNNARLMRDQQEHALRLITLQWQAGVASANDVRLAEVNLHNAQANVPGLEAGARSSVAALGPLTSLPSKVIADLLARVEHRPTLPEKFDTDINSDVLLRRPDLRVAERNLAAATADVGVSVANQYPRFTILAQAGWDSINSGQLVDQASRYWNVGPQFSLPLFSGGAIRAQVAVSEAARDAALASYRKSVLLALADVESSMLRCKAGDLRLVELQRSQESQVHVQNFAQQRFEVGDATQLELIAAQLQTAGILDQMLVVEQAFAQDAVSFYKAIGGSVASRD